MAYIAAEASDTTRALRRLADETLTVGTVRMIPWGKDADRCQQFRGAIVTHGLTSVSAAHVVVLSDTSWL